MATTVGNVIFQISADLKNVQGQLRTLEGNFQSSFSKISATASQAFGAIGLSLSTAAIVGFVKTSVSEIGKLQDVFERTGISADVLLKLRPILENAGSSVEEFANGVNAMQKALVDGSAQTIEAFQKVGISANEILKLAEDPEELLDRVAKGLANVATQTERVAIARDLASRAGARIAPALLELAKGGGVEGLRKTESVISKEDIAAIDAAGDAFNTMFIKAEAIAAKSFINVLQGFKDVAAYIQEHPIKFIFNIDGGFFEIAGKARQLREDVAKATAGAQIGGAKTLVEGTAPGLKETNAQRDFKKALDEQIDGLKSQALALSASKEAAIANAAEIIKNKAAQIGLTESSEELAKRLQEFKQVSLQIQQAQFADQLIKSNQSLQIQITTMTHGKQAADELALSYAIANAKLDDMGDAARKAAETQKVLNQRLVEAKIPEIQNTLETESNRAQLKNKEGDISVNIAALARDALQKASDSLDEIIADKFTNETVKKLAIDAKLIIEPQLDDRKLDAITEQVLADFTLAERKADVLNRVFANSFDESAAKIETLKAQLENALRTDRGTERTPAAHELVLSLGSKLDQAQLDQAFTDLNKELTIASDQAEVFGRSFDLGSANISAIQSQLEKLTRDGLSPANEEMQKLASQLRDAKVADVFSDLSKDLETAAREAEVLGGAVNLPSETVDRLTDSIKRLIAEGLDPLDPKLQDLKAQLEDAKAAEHFADAFQGIGDSFLGAFTDLADGGKLKDVMKRLVSNINRSITDALITKPFEDWIKKQANELFGGFLKLPVPAAGTGQSVGIPGAAGQIAGAAGTQPAVIAIQTVATEATTAIQTSSATTQTSIQAVSAESTAGIQAGLAVAESTITTLGATTQAAITAIETAAITAIQTAGAASGVSGGSALGGIPLIGSLFGGGGGAAAAGGVAAGSDFASVGAGEIFSTFPALLHKGGKVEASLPTQRFHQGGPVGPAINFVALSKSAQTTLARFHTGGAIGTTVNSSHLGAIAFGNVTHFHTGGTVSAIGPTEEGRHIGRPLRIFHDGGIMGGGKIMAQSGADQTGLKPGERMIIAQDGEFVINKKVAMQIGMDKLQKLNRDQATIMPKFHFGGIIRLSPQSSVLSTFHGGGMIVPAQEGDRRSPLRIANVERYHDGGTVSLTEGWSSPINDFSLMSAIPVAQTGMIPAGRAGGQGGGGNSVNVANFYNPQFQNRQSVGQTSAQLTAAMEAGKRNR